MIIGYISDSVQKVLLNDLDVFIIEHAKRKIAALRRLSGNEALDDDPQPEEAAAARREALIQFVLILSDTQFVTGLAMLISGVASQKSLSGFEFSVVLSLAWFSSTTHLATLDVLMNYLQARGILRNFRVAGMITLLGFLVYAQFINLEISDYSLPVQCVFSSQTSIDYTSDALFIIIFLLQIFPIVSQYFSSIQCLYLADGSLLYGWKWLKWHLFPKSHPSDVAFGELFAEYRASLRLRRLENIKRSSGPFRLLRIGLYSYLDSFLSTIPTIGYSFSFGLSVIVTSRFLNAPELSPDSSHMGFGQVMPLFLLCLPFLSGGEILYGIIFPEFQAFGVNQLIIQRLSRNSKQAVCISTPVARSPTTAQWKS